MVLKRESPFTLAFILTTILLDMIGLGIILPVLPNLIHEITGGTTAQSAVLGGYLVFVYALMQFLFSPVLGNFSDRFGRRPILLLSLMGLTLDYLIMGFAPTLIWLFVGRTLAGISGAAVTTAMAYIADITPAEKRSQRFGLIGAAFGLGFIIGPVLGGELGEFSPRAPFYAAAALAFANLLFGFFILPESLTMRNRRRFDIKRANPFGTILAFKRFPLVLWLLGSLFLFALAGQAIPSVWNFFTIERFGWSSSQIGRSLAIFGILFALTQAFLVGPVTKRLGESFATLSGMIIAAIAFIGLSFIHTSEGLYVFLVIGALSGLAPPAINGLMSQHVPDNAQGELQGAVNATNSLTAIIGPVAATHLFSFFTTSPDAPGYFPGVPFLGAGIAVTLAAIVFTVAFFRFDIRHTPHVATDPHTPGMARPGEVAYAPPRDTRPEKPDNQADQNDA